ncbi:MAG: hypothetical protein KGO48_16750, partial [Alphaproteobacteria bacterium]|nr:hypothetical protein [Alphaproteobacteria bacterium]
MRYLHAGNRALLLAGCSSLALAMFVGPTAADPSKATLQIKPNSVVVSASTYDRTQGAIATLTTGVTQIANTDTATVTAVAGNNYVTTWNNANVDGSYGVTSPIQLLDVSGTTGHIFHA